MDKCKDWIYKNQEKMKIFFAIGALIAIFNCLTRSDYNVVLYLYLYYLFDTNYELKNVQAKEKLFTFFFLTFSILIDIFWVLYWSSKWNNIKDFERTIHTIVVLTSWIGIGVKGFIIFSYGLVEWASIKSSLPKKFQEKLAQSQGYQEQNDN